MRTWLCLWKPPVAKEDETGTVAKCRKHEHSTQRNMLTCEKASIDGSRILFDRDESWAMSSLGSAKHVLTAGAFNVSEERP